MRVILKKKKKQPSINLRNNWDLFWMVLVIIASNKPLVLIVKVLEGQISWVIYSENVGFKKKRNLSKV